MTKKNEPTKHMVAEVIVRQMMEWNPHANEKKRRTELYDLAEALIRYFAAFNYAPAPAILPGLPGGAPIGSDGKVLPPMGNHWDG